MLLDFYVSKIKKEQAEEELGDKLNFELELWKMWSWSFFKKEEGGQEEGDLQLSSSTLNLKFEKKQVEVWISKKIFNSIKKNCHENLMDISYSVYSLLVADVAL